MQTATFWANHIPSNSRVILEFGLVKKKVKLIAVAYLRGKVLDINAFKALRKRATFVLLNG